MGGRQTTAGATSASVGQSSSAAATGSRNSSSAFDNQRSVGQSAADTFAVRGYRAISFGVGQQNSQRVVTNRNTGSSQAVGGSSPLDSEDSTPDEGPLSRAFFTSSLPVHLFSVRDIKCPVCNKSIPTDDVECHLVMCLTRPRIIYNEDVLTESKGECVICLEELQPGDTIARLPCLCVYHKRCIDDWFKVKRSCPEHPND